MAMNLGISSYCLCKKLYTNEMTMFDILDWAKENGCTHLEICPFGLPLMLEDVLVKAVRWKMLLIHFRYKLLFQERPQKRQNGEDYE